MTKTAKVELYVKDPDQWQELASELELTEEQRDRYFEYGEYARMVLTFDSNLTVVSGRLLPMTVLAMAMGIDVTGAPKKTESEE